MQNFAVIHFLQMTGKIQPVSLFQLFKAVRFSSFPELTGFLKETLLYDLPETHRPANRLTGDTFL